MNGEERIITIEVVGSAADDGHLRLDDLVSQLQTLESALEETARIISAPNRAKVYFRVVAVKHESPISLSVEPVSESDKHEPDYSSRVSKTFFSAGQSISKRGAIPQSVDARILRPIKNMALGLRSNISRLAIIHHGVRVPITNRFVEKVDFLIAQSEADLMPETREYGSVKGKLVGIKLWGKNQLAIEPNVGPRRLECYFTSPIIEDRASKSVKKIVEVFGTLYFQRGERFPGKIDVQDMVILEPDEDKPKMRNFFGMAPEITGDLTVDDYLDNARKDW